MRAADQVIQNQQMEYQRYLRGRARRQPVGSGGMATGSSQNTLSKIRERAKHAVGGTRLVCVKWVCQY